MKRLEVGQCTMPVPVSAAMAISDRDFTSNIKDEATSKLVKFVAEVCDELKLEMIGEGIETEEEKNKMIDLGCTIGQGYLMHMPSFVDEFEIEK